MVREFYYRLSTLFFIMLSLCLLVAIFAILPSYFLSVSKNKIAEEKLEIQKSIPLPPFDQEALTTIQELNKKIALIENAEKNKFSVSEKAVKPVVLKKIQGIKITQISYEDNTISGKKITISGTASSREALLLFRQALESEPSFKSVDLPISNFIKGTNIEFSLNAIPS